MKKRFSNLCHSGTNDFENGRMDILLGAVWSDEFIDVLKGISEYNAEEDPSHISVYVVKTPNGFDYQIGFSDGYDILDQIKFTDEEKEEILTFIKEKELHPNH